MSETMTKDIINTRNIIRQKLRNLKLGALHKNIELESQYKPIIKSLQDIAVNLPMVNIKREVKSEPKEEMKEEEKKEAETLKKDETLSRPTFLETSTVAESMDEAGDADVFQSTIMEDQPSITREDILNLTQHPSFRLYLDQFDSLPRQYVEEMVTDDKDLFDFKYGIRHDLQTDKFYIGDSEIIIDGKDLIVQNVRYTGTPGLYELLFKKQPRGYNETDRKNYIDIVKRTNAARRHYSDSEQLSGNRSQKYTSIIAPMLDLRKKTLSASRAASASRKLSSISKRPSSTSGGSYLKKLTKKQVEYVYWDNINELVDRLRLLIASRDAGHTGHNNEIISIIEELKEAGVIE